MTLNIGVGRENISPPPGIYLIGYGNRSKGNRGVHDELTATALAVDDGLHRAVIVACDLLAINEHTVARVQAQTGSNIVICCSHTHSAPITYAGQRSARKNRDYATYLVGQIVKAVKDAQANQQPALLRWGRGEADIALNRRERKHDGHIEIGVNPTGPIDRSLGVLQAQTSDGKVIVTLVNFQCHGTVLGPKNMLVSADWIGAMRCTLEQQTGSLVMYLQGATGDLNPKHTWGKDDFEAVQAIGAKVAGQVAKEIPVLASVSGETVSFHQEQVWLPLEAEARGTSPPTTYRAVLARMAHVPRFLVDFILNYRYPWKTHITAREGYWSVPVVLTHIRLGEVAIYALGAEVFTEIGMAIKQASHATPTLFASVSSGCIGYLPTASEHALGGYEVDISPYLYRMPGRLNADSADRVLEAVRNLL
jgi:neutral ceramidase